MLGLRQDLQLRLHVGCLEIKKLSLIATTGDMGQAHPILEHDNLLISGSLAARNNIKYLSIQDLLTTQLLWEAYSIEYKLDSISGVVVIYIQVGRTGINADLIRIKLYWTQNICWVMLFQLSIRRGLCRQSYLITGYQIWKELSIVVRPIYEAVSFVVT